MRRLDLAPAKRFPMGLVLLGDVQRLFRHRQLHARALQGGEHVHAHRGVGGIIGLRVEHPVAQRIARVARDQTPSARKMAGFPATFGISAC
jgi:hypothetical protein